MNQIATKLIDNVIITQGSVGFLPGSSHRQTRHPDSSRESGQPRVHLSRMSGHRRSRSIREYKYYIIANIKYQTPLFY